MLERLRAFFDLAKNSRICTHIVRLWTTVLPRERGRFLEILDRS